MRYSCNRRLFLQVVAGSGFGLLAGATGRAAETAAAQRLGVQLYTLRDQLSKNARDTLKAVAAIGFREVEILRGDMRRLEPLLRELDLAAPSAHIEAPVVTGNWAAWQSALPSISKDYGINAAIDDANALDTKYLVVAYLMPQERGGLDAYRRFADQMNTAGEACRSAGLALCYHHHSFELEPIDGMRPLDVLIDRFDAALVSLEVDVFWVAMGGGDPVAFLAKHGQRVALVHLKDKAPGAQPEFQESKVAPSSFAEVGSGSLDFPAILRAARKAGTKHFFVEQDHTPGDPIASLTKSYEYLKGIW